MRLFRVESPCLACQPAANHVHSAQAGKAAGKHLYAPVVLLRRTDDEQLKGVPVPIAVKLAKGEKEIITPGSDTSEKKWGWTLAKVRGEAMVLWNSPAGDSRECFASTENATLQPCTEEHNPTSRKGCRDIFSCVFLSQPSK